MNEVGNFNITHTESPTNKNIIVVFSPYSNVESYLYEIYKDQTLLNRPFISKSKATINLNGTGVYQIKITATLKDGSKHSLSSGYYVIDKQKPEITVKSENIEIKSNELKEIEENATAQDNYDGNITNQIETNINKLNLKSHQNQKLIYTITDRAGNKAEKMVNIKIIQNTNYFSIEAILIIFTLIFAYLIIKIQKALLLEKRIKPYTLRSLKNKDLSISEKIIYKYQQLAKVINKNFDKSVFAKKYAKKLEKYLPVSKFNETSMDILSGKIIVAFIFTASAFLIQMAHMKFLESYEAILIFTLGFFALDILYFIKYKVFRWKLENDFIAAITIMNNAFKSGRSITQAIDTVSHELKGVIGDEFEKMSLELLYGLGIDTVFKRFAKRIDLEEASYLTASLTILNKTGGDIIKVFDSIERSMFDKRKLRLELSSLTSGSKIVVAVLLGMPFFFALVINIINPEYFVPFFTTSIGIILLIFMIIYYIIFVVVVRKIMKVVI